MSAEAEATDILVKVTMESGQYFLRIAGMAAEKSLALLFAGLKALHDFSSGKKKLGGKINPRTFIENFITSDVFQIKKDDFDKVKSELKRLKIPYMQYKQTKDTKEAGIVEISVRKEDADKFIRICEKFGVGTVEQLDMNVQEVGEEEYENLLSSSTSAGASININEKGEATIEQTQNPTQAPTNPLSPSEQNSPVSEHFEFDPTKSVDANLKEAERFAGYDNGTLIPISINKTTLLQNETADNITVRIPYSREYIVIPKEDILTTEADGGKTIRADLKHNKDYNIVKKDGTSLRYESGTEIKAKGKWDVKKKPLGKSSSKAPKIPSPDVIKGGK